MCYTTVMNQYTGAYINRNEFSDGELVVNSCGNYRITKEDFRTYRENGTNDFQMIYVNKGELKVNTTEKTYNDGAIVFFPPEMRHDYIYVAEKNTDVFWLHFGGSRTEEILSKFNIDVFTSYSLQNASSDFINCFQNIIREITIKNEFFKELCVSYFYRILIFLARNRKKKDKNSAKENAFSEIIERMYFDDSGFDIKAYAESCCLSVSRFAHMFKQSTGMPPHAFYSQIIANKAKDLIFNSSLNISEIAEILGFTDIYYFSRFYKKNFGVSPSIHRKNKS